MDPFTLALIFGGAFLVTRKPAAPAKAVGDPPGPVNASYGLPGQLSGPIEAPLGHSSVADQALGDIHTQVGAMYQASFQPQATEPAPEAQVYLAPPPKPSVVEGSASGQQFTVAPDPQPLVELPSPPPVVAPTTNGAYNTALLRDAAYLLQVDPKPTRRS